ncbi:putative transcription factor OFP family [Helianthus annuus]|uniref:Transcription repressor n=1 Tax=Helianthus annuus TaxID=4232 RepID=A0A9K3ND88_HELAN|nr:putative transcription factor OFP family [Helianthus annuus]KAJ0901742.1 putative transcription factor OFP family [Helianthus annuus]
MTHKELSKNSMKKRRERVSFSASLPEDVHGVFADSDCVVQYSSHPFLDIRKSILEMIRYAKVQDWNDIEELIYCYIALNSPETHIYIKDAFVSLSFPLSTKH